MTDFARFLATFLRPLGAARQASSLPCERDEGRGTADDVELGVLAAGPGRPLTDLDRRDPMRGEQARPLDGRDDLDLEPGGVEPRDQKLDRGTLARGPPARVPVSRATRRALSSIASLGATRGSLGSAVVLNIGAESMLIVKS